jgi:hypothetical protein
MPNSETSYVTLKIFHKDIASHKKLFGNLSHLMSMRHTFSANAKEA